MPRLTLIASAIAILLTTVAHPASAAVSENTIDAVATLSTNGRHIVVTGPIACTQGERVRIRVTVTQSATGAVAQGKMQRLCTGAVQQWAVRVVARGPLRFEAGAAEACAVAITRMRGTVTDTRQWCRSGGITLQAGE